MRPSKVLNMQMSGKYIEECGNAILRGLATSRNLEYCPLSMAKMLLMVCNDTCPQLHDCTNYTFT